MLNRSWVEIDLEQIAKNYNIYKKTAGREIMAVVKADAYGHGDVEVALRLQDEGCENFGVSNILEAIKIRQAGIKGQILILGYTPVSSAEELIRHDITQAILSEEYADELALFCEKNGIDSKKIKAHFAIDTGMNRIGLDGDDTDLCEKAIRKYAKIFDITGIFTHLCVADTPSEKQFTKSQIDKFQAVAEKISDMKLPFIHFMNSAGGIWESGNSAFARLGIILYGLKPDYANTLPQGIKPALKWKSVISMIKSVHPGETIGYGRTYTAEKEMRVATIPTGYADGYNRFLSNVGSVVIAGKKAKIVGRICMDQFMVDVTDIPEATFGTEVELIGEAYGADDMANDIGTIGYEIVCNITKRVERRYI